MTYAQMLAHYKAITGQPAFISNEHPAGPSLCTKDRRGRTYGIVIPIDAQSRIGVAEALASDAGHAVQP